MVMLVYLIFVVLTILHATLSKIDEFLDVTIKLQNNVHIPRIGLGTAGLRDKTRILVDQALSSGFRLIDTAQAAEWYDESGVGLGISDFLSKALYSESYDITIVTKIHPRSFSYNKMHDMLIQSRELLMSKSGSQSPLDIVLLHSPRCWTGHCTSAEQAISWQTGWKNLETMKINGLVSNIGVSNFELNELKEIVESSEHHVSVIQNWLDPFHQDWQVVEYCKLHNIVYMAYSSFGTQWEHKMKGNPVFSSPELISIAKKHQTTISQVVLSWLLQEGVVAIPRSSSFEHINENASLFNIDSESGETITVKVFLDHDDIEYIRSLDGTLGNLWD